MSALRRWWTKNFTLHRWALNPFQMYDISFLMAVAIAQIQLGATPGSVQADMDRHTLMALATCNMVGAGIALLGLHRRDLEDALWIELCGYLCLIFVLGYYVLLLSIHQVNTNASYGFAFSEAFVYAAIHRSAQIWLYKRARKKRQHLDDQATALKDAMLFNAITPKRPVGDE